MSELGPFFPQCAITKWRVLRFVNVHNTITFLFHYPTIQAMIKISLYFEAALISGNNGWFYLSKLILVLLIYAKF